MRVINKGDQFGILVNLDEYKHLVVALGQSSHYVRIEAYKDKRYPGKVPNTLSNDSMGVTELYAKMRNTLDNYIEKNPDK